MRAAVYARVSTTDQAKEGTSLDTQRQQTRAFIEMRNWELVGEYVDEGVSGAKASRPELDRLWSDCRAGNIDAVVVSKLDRYGRSMVHLANSFDELDRLGIVFASVSEALDSSTPTGRLMRNNLSSFAEFERDRISERMNEGLLRTAEAGFWTGGPPPFGYRIAPDPRGSKQKVLVIDKEQRDLLQLVFDLIVNQGYSTYTVAPYLNAHGYRTVRKRMWRHENLCFRLRQPYLTGTWRYRHRDGPIEVSIPPIFTQEEWETLQANIKGRPRGQRKNRLYPLTGRGRVHLRCDCGGNFYGMTDVSKKGRSYYTCSRDDHSFGSGRCPHLPRTIRAPDLERAVLDEVCSVLSDDAYITSLAEEYVANLPSAAEAATDLERTQQSLVSLQQQKVRIARTLAETDELDAFDAAVAEINTEIRELEARLHEQERIAEVQHQSESVEERVRSSVADAQRRLENPDLNLLAELFDILSIDLVRKESTLFEGEGSIPLPDNGDVWEEGLLLLTSIALQGDPGMAVQFNRQAHHP